MSPSCLKVCAGQLDPNPLLQTHSANCASPDRQTGGSRCGRKITSSTRTISTGAPQECVLSSLLFSRYTDDCTSGDSSFKLLKFAGDTTVICLIRDSDKSAPVWSEQPGAEHTQNHGDDSGLKEEPPNTAPIHNT